MLDAVSMFDDEIMEMYLEARRSPTTDPSGHPQGHLRGGDDSRGVRHQATATRAIQRLLDAIVEYMPSPLMWRPSRA